ncbi:hypothetical protein ACJX0J_006302, partial [Zea mays]
TIEDIIYINLLILILFTHKKILVRDLCFEKFLIFIAGVQADGSISKATLYRKAGGGRYGVAVASRQTGRSVGVIPSLDLVDSLVIFVDVILHFWPLLLKQQQMFRCLTLFPWNYISDNFLAYLLHFQSLFEPQHTKLNQ